MIRKVPNLRKMEMLIFWVATNLVIPCGRETEVNSKISGIDVVNLLTVLLTLYFRSYWCHPSFYRACFVSVLSCYWRGTTLVCLACLVN